MSNEAEQVAQRKAKLDELTRLGVAPYPNRFDRTITIAEVVREHGGSPPEALEASRPHARVAGRLLSAGIETSVVARGEHLKAIRANGLYCEAPDGRFGGKLPASDNPADLGKQDVVVIGVKAHGVPPIIDGLKTLWAGVRLILHRRRILRSRMFSRAGAAPPP